MAATTVAQERRCVVCESPLADGKKLLCGSTKCRNQRYMQQRSARGRAADMAAKRVSGRFFRAWRDKGRKPVCTGCLERFDPKSKGHARFCSRECFQRHQKAIARWLAIQQRVDAVLVNAAREAEADTARELKALIARAARCLHCKAMFYRTKKWGKFCSEVCRDKQITITTKRLRRITKRKNRARMKAIRVENVDPLVVFERDGWRCQCCRRRVRMDVPTTHPLYPNLDHIIPKSVDGTEHSYRNTQCLCRGCNQSKRDKRGGHQLRLIG